MTDADFQKLLMERAGKLYRDMPWRRDTRPYYVLVSELMLQQTQVARVIPKFEAFISAFPNEHLLASASLAEVITLWQGLGYNRRAKYLHEAVKMLVSEYSGTAPETEKQLLTLPGVGKNTAGAILAYSFNQPAIFIETNIRTVYIHHFFRDDFSVEDSAIYKKLVATIDQEHPREFYWALMDYGSYLKQQGVRNSTQSKHYVKQSSLSGSVREIRGRIVRELSATNGMSTLTLQKAVDADARYEKALTGLIKDGLVVVTKKIIHLTK